MQRQVLPEEAEPQRHREEGRLYSGEVSPHFAQLSYSFCAPGWSPKSLFVFCGQRNVARVKAGRQPTAGFGSAWISQLWGTACAFTWKKQRVFLTPVPRAGLNPALVVLSARFSQEQHAHLCFWQEALPNACICLSLSRQTYPGCISTRVRRITPRDEFVSCKFSHCCLWQHCNMQRRLRLGIGSSSYFVSCRG